MYKTLKILFSILLVSFMIQETFAQYNTVLDPDYWFIQNNAQDDATVFSTYLISWDLESATRFCVDYGGTYVNHDTQSYTQEVAYYSGSLWSSKLWTTISDAITCDIQYATNGYDWDTTTREYMQLWVYKDWEYIVNLDSFLFVLIISFVALLLIKTLINIAKYAFVWGVYLSSWEKILWKK